MCVKNAGKEHEMCMGIYQQQRTFEHRRIRQVRHPTYWKAQPRSQCMLKPAKEAPVDSIPNQAPTISIWE
jgi:hypothetical protein